METLVVERSAGIVTVTLNRPEKKNAVTVQMWQELRDTFRQVAANVGEDRVVVLTGAGGAFSSGADLADAGSIQTHFLVFMRGVTEACLALRALPQPVIAKVTGVAAGGGMNLALGCDLIVASEEARFSEVFSRRGLSVDCGGSWLLPRLIGVHKAKELVLFAEVIGAKEAAELGLVNRVVPASEIDAFVADWARRLASGPPLALSMSKRLLDQGLTVGLDQALEAEAQAQTVNFGTADLVEGATAFFEKREPRFQGR